MQRELAIGLACSSALVSTAGWAQSVPADAVPTTATEAPAAADADIIVTARKRSERLNDVPVSITAATGEQLTRQGITRVADLEKIVPGFTFQPSAYGAPVFTIRGIGFYETSLAVAPAVSVYVDQIPLPYSYMTTGASLDLERVEVLKGPQGTLFGQNSTGGAINYIAAKPTADLRAGLQLGAGRFGAFSEEGFVSGPLTDTLRVRIALRGEQQGNWQRSQTRDDGLGHRDFLNGRFLLDWAPTDRIKFELNASGWRDKSDSVAAQFLRYSPTNPAGFQDQAAALSAYRPAPEDARVADWDPDTSFRRDDSFKQISLRGDIGLGDHATLSSITAYSHLKINAPVDVDGTSYNNGVFTTIGGIKSFSQELRLSGDAIDDRLQYMIGGNYGRDRTTDNQFGHYTGSNSGVGPFRYNFFINTNNQKFRNKAVFGSLDFKLTPTISLQGSARYTKTDIDFRGCLRDSGNGQLAAAFSFLASLPPGQPTTIPAGACVTFGVDGTVLPIVTSSLDQDNVSWRGGISWKPNRDSLLYANVTKGYKSGSYPTLPGLTEAQFKPVTQEALLAYEAGFKLTLLDNALQLDGAAFYYKYDDKQIVGYVNTGIFGNLPALVNVPKSSVRGAELSATVRPLTALTVRLGASYVDSQVDRSFTVADPFSVQVDVKGEAFPNTPKWQLSGDAEYDFSLNARLKAFVGVSGRYRSRSVAAFGRAPEFNLRSYGILDLRAGIETPDSRWRLELYGRNVTDTFYVTQVLHTIDSVSRLAGMPATYGVVATFRY